MADEGGPPGLYARFIQLQADAGRLSAEWPPTEHEHRARIESWTTAQLGRRSAERLLARVDASPRRDDTSPARRLVDDEDWIDDAAWSGDGLTDEELFEVILAALELAAGHAWALGYVGDGSMDHLVGRDVSYALRFHEARRTNPAVREVFEVMHTDLDSCGLGHGWWADDYPRSAQDET